MLRLASHGVPDAHVVPVRANDEKVSELNEPDDLGRVYFHFLVDFQSRWIPLVHLALRGPRVEVVLLVARANCSELHGLEGNASENFKAILTQYLQAVARHF